jgi:serine/threonine protein kinase
MSEPEALHEDYLFAGKYRLLRVLGKGAMGEVWLGEEQGPRGFRRRVAVKRLLSAQELGEYATESFVAEAQVIARIDHPNVVRLIEFGTDEEGLLYLVLDFVDGTAMDMMLKAGGKLSPASVAYIGREVARALHAVHSLCDDDGTNFGVVHRDISPSNILVSRDGRVRLTDFGVARISGLGGNKTETGVFKGKIPYMPPEQAKGEPFDGRADVFALGVTLFELLLGKRLRRAETHAQLLFMIATERVPHVLDLIPDAPPRLAAAIDHATELSASTRTESAGKLADALAAMLHELGPTAEADAVAEIKSRIDQASALATARLATDASRQGAQSRPGSGSGPKSLTRSAASGSGSGSIRSTAGPKGPPSNEDLVATAAISVARPDAGAPSGTSAGTAIEPHPPARRSTGPLVAGVALLAGVGIALAVVRMTKEPEKTATQSPSGQPSTSTVEASPTALDTARSAAPIASAPATSAPSAALSVASAKPEPSSKPEGPSTGRKPPPPPPPAPTDSAAVDPKTPATLTISVSPWGEVSVDGRPVGMTPLPPLTLAPGPHSITVRNPDLGATRSQSVNLKPGAKQGVFFDLKKSEGP